MKIGVKYCGGCNPRYDRTRIVSRLREEFRGLDIVRADAQGGADLVAVICGCPVQCAEHADLNGCLGKVVLTREEDYEKLRALILQNYTEFRE
ncbi:hypothetical protein EQM14_06635 [Caproiciproducens sp. NJN-50]|uniref:hypothetical protein n=1 Tax=Acutalibacteraceae TaxID=3082771 RepID=UPI000FFE284B|nr:MULTISPECIES: hypothetical protein [Acutalibacteraceae]QAT49478.1 hypothetical protein EQM14_06635 [Caproiciproducens sp. NJN-50]